LGSRKLTAVADAGPLIHLAEIGGLHFLSSFDTIHIPDAVWTETFGQGRLSQRDLFLIENVKRHLLTRKEVESFVKEKKIARLHAGEQECLFVCVNEGLSLILTDDLAVREAAKQLGLVPVGSLGIVVSAFKHGELSLEKAEKYIADLYDVSSLFVTRAIVDLAIKQLRLSGQ